MKPATLPSLKKELQYRSHDQLIEYCLKMARFKLESKELLTYLVFESENEENYTNSVKEYIDLAFSEINTDSYYYIKKSVRKILRQTKRYIRYSKKKETEALLLIYFCKKLKQQKPSYKRNSVLTNTFNKQLELAIKAISKLHEDLQYDYNQMISALID